ncbi:hypothetical protein PUN28_011125 [Cardiocondyla obscurior]|uniref:Gustatory receptor n=1 Tax=Cardiocondyla obscurior TaxID=286306 RepID=A0AAW2FMS3_9HYME
MKLFARPSSFTEAMTSMIYFNYFLGLRVFEYPRGYPRSVLSFIYFLIIYFIFCAGVFNANVYYMKQTKPLKLGYIIYTLMKYLNTASVIIKMFTGWWHSKQIAECHKMIFEIDKTLQQIGLVVNYDRIYFMSIGIVTVWLLIVTILITTANIYFFSRLDILKILNMVFASLMVMTVDYVNTFEFYVFLRCLQTKFELVNHLLRETLKNLSMQETKLRTFELKDYTKLIDFEQKKNIFSTKMTSQWSPSIYSATNLFVLSKRSPVQFQIKTNIPLQFNKELQNELWNQSQKNIFTTKFENHTHLLQIIKQVHLELSKVSKLICSAFGIQIAWEVGSVILSVINILFSFYHPLFIQKADIPLRHTFMAILLCLINFLKIFLLSRACKNAADEGNKAIELIHITHGSNTEDSIKQEEIQQFGIQILQSPVTFYVFGLTMNNHILSMVSLCSSVLFPICSCSFHLIIYQLIILDMYVIVNSEQHNLV